MPNVEIVGIRVIISKLPPFTHRNCPTQCSTKSNQDAELSVPRGICLNHSARDHIPANKAAKGDSRSYRSAPSTHRMKYQTPPPRLSLNLEHLKSTRSTSKHLAAYENLPGPVQSCRVWSNEKGDEGPGLTPHAFSTPGRRPFPSGRESRHSNNKSIPIGAAWNRYQAFTNFSFSDLSDDDLDSLPETMHSQSRGYSDSSRDSRLGSPRNESSRCFAFMRECPETYSKMVGSANNTPSCRSGSSGFQEKWTAARPPSSGRSSSLQHHENRRNISSAPQPTVQSSTQGRPQRPSTSIPTWQDHPHGRMSSRDSDSEKSRFSSWSYHSIPCRKRHKKVDPIEKARRVTRSPPDFPVRWRRRYPSKVECKMLVAEMVCQDNHKRNRAQKSRYMKAILKKYLHSNSSDSETENQPVVLDGWSFAQNPTQNHIDDVSEAERYVDHVHREWLKQHERKDEQEILRRRHIQLGDGRKNRVVNPGFKGVNEMQETISYFKSLEVEPRKKKTHQISEMESFYRYWDKPDIALDVVANVLKDSEKVWDEWEECEDEQAMHLRLERVRRRIKENKKSHPAIEYEEDDGVSTTETPLHEAHLHKKDIFGCY